MSLSKVSSSFRDPSGFVFWNDGILSRKVNHCYKEQYQHLMSSGLYDILVKKKLLVSHKEVKNSAFLNDDVVAVLQPDVIQFISYPYEWSFSQLKDAALLTLEIQKIALNYGMILKDASAYNVQFKEGKPVFIDTLSFDLYEKGEAWKAYKQFCQHFLAPLALMSHCDVRLNQLYRSFIDGVPLDMASSMLPLKTRMRPSLLLHIHLHSKAQRRYEDSEIKKGEHKKLMSQNAILGLIDSLKGGIEKLRWRAEGTEWVDYYDGDSYTKDGFEYKKKIVSEFLKLTEAKVVWDLGANDGVFSRIASQQAFVLSWDIDPACVDNNYRLVKERNEKNLLPLILDLTNPSGGIGWGGAERYSLAQRGPADCIMALALVHHLAISNNVPFSLIAKYFSTLCNWLIIEFVPKDDKKVQKLLATREDVFPDYTLEGFEKDFGVFFEIYSQEKINDSKRSIYLMKKKNA